MASARDVLRRVITINTVSGAPITGMLRIVTTTAVIRMLQECERTLVDRLTAGAKIQMQCGIKPSRSHNSGCFSESTVDNRLNIDAVRTGQ